MKIFENCLAAAVTEGKISQKTADEYTRRYNDAAKEAIQMGKGDPDISPGAYAFATSTAAERMMAQVGKNKARVADEIVRTQMRINGLENYKVGDSWFTSDTTPAFRALQRQLGERVRGEGDIPSLWEQQRAAKMLLNRAGTDIIEAIRSKNWGLTKDRVEPWAMVQEHYGNDSGSASAKANIQAWKDLSEKWADMMEEEKVFIARREDYLWPQKFNTVNVRIAGQEAFTEGYLQKMREGHVGLRDWQATGDAYLDPVKDEARIREILGGTEKKPGAFVNITTHGNASIEPGAPIKESMADRYNHRRVFDYLTLDGYKWFQDTWGFGSQNMGEQMMKHMDQMAHDLGTARALGGDPDKMKDTLLDWGKRKGLDKKQVEKLEATYFQASGKAHEAANVTMANFAGGVRQWLASTQLGGATLSSAPDFAFLKNTAAFNGLEFTRQMRFYLEALKDDPRKARQMAVIADTTGIRGLRDHWDDNALPTATKFKNGMTAGEGLEAASSWYNRAAGQAAEAVMRGTGLEAHSNAGRISLGKELLATAADHAEVKFGDLEPRFQGMLKRYGIDEGDWNVLRADAMQGERLFMDPAWLAWEGTAAQRQPAMKMLGMIDAESKFAIPEGGVTTKAWLLGMTKPGTVAGELLRTIQYKGFTLSTTMMHGWRGIDQIFDKSGMMPRGQYLIALAIEATLLGALSYQLKNIVAGKDPEAMDTPAFWGKAAAMGGAGGMLGDQIKTAMQTTSKDDAARMLSPTGGLILNTMALSSGNLAQFMHGDTTNIGRESANYLRQYLLPRLFYTSLAVDRIGFDNVQRWWDRDAAGAFQRIEQRARKQNDTRSWWSPGHDQPSRPPDLEAALGSFR